MDQNLANKHICHKLSIRGRLQFDHIRDNQFGFRQGMSTTEPVFALRQLQDECREKKKDLHMVFVDLEKAFDRIPRDLTWWCLRKKGVSEEYVQIVQDM